MSPQSRAVVDTRHDALSEPLLASQNQEHVEEQDPCNSNDSVNDSVVETKERSPNIRWILAYTLFAFAGRAIWYQSVLSTYCYLLRNDNPESVGFITSVMGISQLLASLPTGVLTDGFYSSSGQQQLGRRDVLLRTAFMVGTVAIALTVCAIYKESYILLTAALGVWGCVWGIANTVLTAIFADSIEDGDRSKYFTQRSILIKLGNTTGPLVALVLFATLGDQWTIHHCSVVMMVGQVICLPSIILLCCPSDKHVVTPFEPVADTTLPQGAESVEVRSPNNDLFLFSEKTNASSSSLPLLLYPSSESIDSDETNNDEWMSTLESEGDDRDESLPLISIEEPVTVISASENAVSDSIRCCLGLHDRMIPILVALADIVAGLASGMSIRYFPIFFYENLELGPVAVQVLGVLAPLTGTILAHAAQRWSLTIGPCRMTCIYKWIGITCMLLMIASYKLQWPVWCTCLLYMVRTSFMNSTSALTKSVLMDAVPSSERGKWSALESVNMFSWSGSAFFGGLIVGKAGILFNFCITATLQFLATIPLLVLFTKFERHQQQHEETATSSSTSSHAIEAVEAPPTRLHFTADDRFKV